MRKLFITVLIIGLISLIAGVALPAILVSVYTAQNGAAGIIGGADISYLRLIYKTAEAFLLVIWGVSLTVFGLAGTVFKKTAKENCGFRSVSLGAGIGVCTGIFFYCIIAHLGCFFLTDPKDHPITYPASVTVGILCFIAMLVLFCAYTNYRKEKPSVKGVILDVFLGLCIPLPVLFSVGYAHNYISDLLYHYYLTH